jgi:hypothetical protein
MTSLACDSMTVTERGFQRQRCICWRSQRFMKSLQSVTVGEANLLLALLRTFYPRLLERGIALVRLSYTRVYKRREPVAMILIRRNAN